MSAIGTVDAKQLLSKSRPAERSMPRAARSGRRLVALADPLGSSFQQEMAEGKGIIEKQRTCASIKRQCECKTMSDRSRNFCSKLNLI